MRNITIIFFLALPFFGMAQGPHPILRSFSAVKQTNGVLLKWVIKGGQQCQGTKVHRADDSFMFEQINHIPGVCGSFTDDETYTFFDTVPVPNAYNHYRLELGYQGFSDTVTAFFEDFGSKNYLLLTDAERNTYRVLFSNDRNREATIQVFDITGKIMYQDSRIANDFLIEPTTWPAGVYVFRVLGVAESDITGKLYFSGQ
ncbi:MAG: T9SS type A sorting domain-containing protein [Flavobacteriales bacterium]|nr:T9SS type A sorting domain-containing protein [Flavobacteriales bacterium]